MPIIHERIERFYPSIKLPEITEEQNRGFLTCCDELLVLGSPDSESWKSDVSSAWIKLSDVSDTADFTLLKDGIPVTNYVIDVLEFPNEENAFYVTIKWQDVLALEGVGCYELKIDYNISGLVNGYTWAKYTLLPYSIENALKTARIRVIFNSKQEIEGINFTGARVEDSIRFFGFIGNKQPNTEIDNLIYQDRIVQSVVRENLNTYIITTDPYKDEFIRKFTDLYLLSENELFISDYNAHNHNYRILDIPQIVEEAPEIDYLDKFQRRAVLTCKTGDKRKNKRTYY
jgi:hypothetical protein